MQGLGVGIVHILSNVRPAAAHATSGGLSAGCRVADSVRSHHWIHQLPLMLVRLVLVTAIRLFT
jgi:hypothetical protein